MDAGAAKTKTPRRRYLVYLLLSLPFLGLFWPGLYSSYEPSILGVPFFYWYQLLWVILTSALIWGAYLLDSRRGR